MVSINWLQHRLREKVLLYFTVTALVLCYQYTRMKTSDKNIPKISASTQNRSSVKVWSTRVVGMSPANVVLQDRSPRQNISDTTIPTAIAVIQNEDSCTLKWNSMDFDVQSYEEDTRGKLFTRKNRTKDFNILPMHPNPDIMLNPKRFLLPVLVWGPNNQLVGMRESVFTAIKLNRTFVIPKFEKHGYDKQKKTARFIAPVHRVDLESLCKFISCVTIEQFRKACNGRVGAVMNTRILRLKEVRKIEDIIQLRILSANATDSSSISNLLLPPKATSPKQTMLVFKAKDIRPYFSSTASCMIFPYPFMNLHGKKKESWPSNLHGLVTDESINDKNASPDIKLMSSIMRHSQHPKHLQMISERFIESVMGAELFLSVHWRYNDDDYLSSWNCKKSNFMMNLCKKARNFTVEDFANRIEAKLLSLKVKTNITAKTVYIATPRSALSTVLKVTKILREKQALRAFTSVELKKFLERYNGCEFMVKHSEDILSTVEMEVCSRGIAFLGSDGSWSGNVRNARLFSDNPLVEKSIEDIFDVR